MTQNNAPEKQKEVSNSRRYTGLIASVAFFLFIIALLLLFTFTASNRVTKNTALINEAHSLSNDGQAVIKDLFDLQNSFGESIRSPHMQRVLKRLKANSEHITASLASLDQGGTHTDGEGNDIKLPKVRNKDTLKDIELAREEWAKLEPRVTKYLEFAEDITVDSSDDLTLAVEQAKTSSLLINTALGKVASDVYLIAENEAENIRLIQVAGVIFIFAYFIVFVFFFINRLRASDERGLAARRETKEIMQTVNTGLFLLDKDLNIGNQHSKVLEDIMGTNRLAGENLTSVLRNRISDKDLETTRQFIEQLYNPRVKTKLVNDLNPLNKVMLHNESDGGATSENYLDFRFSRVYEGEKISRILVNVSDVTDAVMLENKLEKEREQNDLQIEMLTTILNVNPKFVNEFIKNTNAHIENINNTLKNPGSSQFELENKLKSIYREMHSLKGEASALQLHSFTQIASDAEDKLEVLQNQAKLSGNDFLPLAVNLDDLVSLTNTIEVLGQRINASTHGKSAAGPTSVPSLTGHSDPANQVVSTSTADQEAEIKKEHYSNTVQQIAERQNKRVDLVTSGLETQVSSDLESVINEISIQLLRNSVVHGIEAPQTRLANSKKEIGTINLAVKKQNGFVKLVIEDDGAGIDYARIRETLVTSGKYNIEEVKALSKGKLLNMLFTSGFSTKDDIDEDAGRGVGLDIIKDRVKQFNGKINVNSDAGQMTRFTIAFPTN